MNNTNSHIAQQLAHVASVLQQQRTGLAPKAVTVVLSEDTLVVTLHDALTPAEKALSRTPEGAAQVQEFHRQLFSTLVRVDAAGDQKDHRQGSARSDGGNRNSNGRSRPCIYDRCDGASVSANPRSGSVHGH